jgi:hypothetical protein
MAHGLSRFANYEFVIYSPIGTEVYTSRSVWNDKSIQISIDHLNTGVYFAVFKSGDKTEVNKLIIE